MSNDKYSSSVKNMLDVNNISEEDEDEVAKSNSTERSRSSSLYSLAYKKSSIIHPSEATSDLSGLPKAVGTHVTSHHCGRPSCCVLLDKQIICIQYGWKERL